MASTTIYKVAKRRKREGKTNYKKRLTLLLSHKPRLVVRKSKKNYSVQVIEYQKEGDRVLISAHSKELAPMGYTGHSANSKAAYLVGYLAGKKAVKNKVKGAILDMGMVSAVRGSIAFAALRGAIDAGLDVPHNTEILPPAETFSDLEAVKKKIS